MRKIAFTVSGAMLQHGCQNADTGLLVQRVDALDDVGRTIGDEYVIGLHERLQGAAPTCSAIVDPLRLERGPDRAHGRDLGIDSWNQRQSPLNVWGVAAIARLTAVAPTPASAGALET